MCSKRGWRLAIKELTIAQQVMAKVRGDNGAGGRQWSGQRMQQQNIHGSGEGAGAGNESRRTLAGDGRHKGAPVRIESKIVP